MFIVKYYLKKRNIGTTSYSTLSSAQSKLDQNDYHARADRYEILNTETNKIVDESEILSFDDIADDMFDGEDSKEGFDWT